jgi:hypothetical protein
MTMRKKHIAACLVATAVAMPASAQSPATPSTDRPAATGTHSTTSGSPAMLPGGANPAPGSSGPSGPSGPAAGTGTAASGATGRNSSDAGAAQPPRAAASGPASGAAVQGQFVAQQQQGQWLASKLIGTRVVSANNETIGDVNDVLIDRNGTAQAIVIGVGGFLGVGEKDVAVPFSALEFASSRDANTTAATSAAGSGASATAATTSARPGASPNVARNGDVDRVVLRLTKSDLQAAPTFQGNRGSVASGAGSAGTPGAPTAGAPPSRP